MSAGGARKLFDLIEEDVERMELSFRAAMGARDRLSSGTVTDHVLIMGLTDTMARSLHDLYHGIEHILEQVAKVIDRERPAGGSYHALLLDQMTRATADRPAVISDSTGLRDLMRFRHFFRNAYAVEMRVEEVVRKVTTFEESIHPDLLRGIRELREHLLREE